MSVSQGLIAKQFLLTGKMIQACDASVAWNPNLNVNYTAKMQFIRQLWIIHEFHGFAPDAIIGQFANFYTLKIQIAL